MARNIYSFIKIEKRQTKRGIYAFWIFYAHIKIEAQKMVLYVGHDIFTEFDD